MTDLTDLHAILTATANVALSYLTLCAVVVVAYLVLHFALSSSHRPR